MKRGVETARRKNEIKIVQLTKDSEFIKLWNSSKEASLELNMKSNSISSCLKGRTKTSGGFKWIYKEDYDNLTHVT
ncbi:hypothetical protein D3C84_1262170 [compost metagenome]